MTEKAEASLQMQRDERAEEPVMRAPAHRLHAAMGAVFESRGRWQVPAIYGSADLETEAIRSALGYADASAQGKVHLSGAVEPWVEMLTGGPLEPLRTAPAGEDGIVARIGRDWAIVLVPPSRDVEVVMARGRGVAGGGMATDITSSMSGFLVAGPRLHDLLARTLTLDLGELRAGACAAATWAKIPAIIVCRDFGGPAVELYVGSEYGRYAWQTLRDVCGALGGSPVGWTALEASGWRS